jgi:deoxycytidine triphosphate deaminase
MQLSDTEISALGESMITPFYPEQVRSVAGTPRISFGLTCAGYDIRLDAAHGLKYFSLASRVETAIDPEMFRAASVLEPLRLFNNLNTDEAWWEVPGFGYVMGLSAETFDMPGTLLARFRESQPMLDAVSSSTSPS